MPKTLRTILLTIVAVGAAAGIALWLWSKRRIEASITVPEDEIKIGKVKPGAGGVVFVDE